ncbi:MAG TPA: TonB-dependent receptor, partial [Flavobacteriales bacterium]|nr:TonB-dependent receptor [Flavobacteriales bacterium]
MNPTDYLFLQSNTGVKNNPNLGAERTIDYEAGFQQVLTKSSSIKFAAFYREIRDQVQLKNQTEAFPRQYRTYDNLDFGTVKGFTVTYDLRRTGNIQLRASYTLQFAEGTGSNTQTALSLINAGKDNLRVTNPLSLDQRHTIT